MKKQVKNQSKKSAKVAKIAAGKTLPEVKAEAIMGDAEANHETVVRDDILAAAMAGDIAAVNAAASLPMPEIEIEDELTTAICTWNNKELTPIALRENSNVLNRFEYVPHVLTVGNRATRFSVLQCSDNGAIVGKPFADSYGLLNNSDFIGIIETIGAALDKLGLKWKVSTTGTLQNRERSFISLQIDAASFAVIDGREFHAFLNCLNSIPSNSGCTVTFANNTFCVCCRNTFAHVLQGKDGAKFHAAVKHTKGMKAVLSDIPVLVESYFSGNEKLFANLKAFSVFPVGLIDAENYFAAFIGRDLKGNLTDKTELKTRSANIVETLQGLFARGKGNKGETALDLFQAVTEYYTHFSAGETDNKTKQFNSSESGDGYFSKNDFYQWLVKHIQEKNQFQAVARVGETLLVNYRAKAAKK